PSPIHVGFHGGGIQLQGLIKVGYCSGVIVEGSAGPAPERVGSCKCGSQLEGLVEVDYCSGVVVEMVAIFASVCVQPGVLWHALARPGWFYDRPSVVPVSALLWGWGIE